jgi:hypothetical protein
VAYNGKHLAQLGVELDAVLPAMIAKAGLASLCVDVDIGGQRVSRAYGEGGRPVAGGGRPIYPAGCLLDVFVATLCLGLAEHRGLDLDTPFIDILPEFAPPTADEAPITVRHLLTRTSGLQDPRTIEEMRGPAPWDALEPRIQAARRLFSPGAVFNYGGIDRAILARLIARHAGVTLDRLGRETIVAPAGIRIRDVQYGPAEPDGHRPIVAFDSTSLLDILSLLARSDHADGRGNPFSEALRNQLQIERLQLSRSLRLQPWPHAPVGFTYGLFKFSDGLIGFNGWEDNNSCAFRLDPQSEVSYVVALHGPPVVRDVIVAEVAQRLGYASVQSRGRPCTIGGLNGLAPGEVLGVYAGWAEGYRASVSLEDGILACELEYRGEKFQRVRARLEDDAWLVVESATRASGLEFFRDRRTGRVCLASGYLPYAMDKAA